MMMTEVSFPPGHDKNPLTEKQLAAKFHGLADPALGAERASEIWTRVSSIDQDARPHEVLRLLCRE
jgi:2-methylcitrate dehydratase